MRGKVHCCPPATSEILILLEYGLLKIFPLFQTVIVAAHVGHSIAKVFIESKAFAMVTLTLAL